MAKGELVTPSRGPLTSRGSTLASGGSGENVWQGYGVQWTSTGLEITVRTSRESYGPLLVGGAAGLIVTLLLIVNLPDPNRGESLVNPVNWLFAAFIGLGVMSAIAAPFYMLPSRWLRDKASETLEIRPDGITLNRKSFFPRHWVHRIGIERLDGDLSEFPWAVIGIIGTRKMTLLAGFDDPTAEVVGAAVEQAKRQLWQESG